MKKTALAIMGLTLASCQWSDLTPAPNQDPVINKILMDGKAVDAPQVRQGQQVVFQLDLWDPNGDTIKSEAVQWTVDQGSLESDIGSSVVWSAPSGMINPNESVAHVAVTVDDGQGGSDQASLDVEVLPACRDDNQPPVVRSVTADPTSIPLGASTVVTADAVDPEGDALSYQWTVPFGYVEGSGPQVTWVTTEVCCREKYPVQVVVSDGCARTWAKTDVEVIP